MFISQRQSKGLICQRCPGVQLARLLSKVHFGASLQQNLNDLKSGPLTMPIWTNCIPTHLQIAVFRSQMKCTVATVVCPVHICSSNHQQMDRGDVPLPDCVMKRQQALRYRFIDLSPASQYNAHLVHLCHSYYRIRQGSLHRIRAAIAGHRHL